MNIITESSSLLLIDHPNSSSPKLLNSENNPEFKAENALTEEDLLLAVVKSKGILNEKNEVLLDKVQGITLPSLDAVTLSIIQDHPSHRKFNFLIEKIWHAIPDLKDSHELHWLGGEVRKVLEFFLEKATLKLLTSFNCPSLLLKRDHYSLQPDTDYKITLYKDSFETLENLSKLAQNIVKNHSSLEWGTVSACDECSSNSYIATHIKDQENHNLDLSLVRGYTRHYLFIRDAIGIKLRKGKQKVIEVIFQHHNPWQVILDIQAKLIHVDDLETLNHMGLVRAWNLLARGYRFVDRETPRLLYQKIKAKKNKSIEELIVKTHQDHDGNDSEALLYTFLCAYEELENNGSQVEEIWSFLTKFIHLTNKSFPETLWKNLDKNSPKMTWIGLRLFSLVNLVMGGKRQGLEMNFSENYGLPYLRIKSNYVLWIPLNLGQLYHDIVELDLSLVQDPDQFFQIFADLVLPFEEINHAKIHLEQSLFTIDDEEILSKKVTENYHKESNSIKKWWFYLFLIVLEKLFPDRNKKLFLLIEFIKILDCFKTKEHQILCLRYLKNQGLETDHFYEVAEKLLVQSNDRNLIQQWWLWHCQKKQLSVDQQWEIYEKLITDYPKIALPFFINKVNQSKFPPQEALRYFDHFTSSNLKGNFNKLLIDIFNQAHSTSKIYFSLGQGGQDLSTLALRHHPFLLYIEKNSALKNSDWSLLHLLALLKHTIDFSVREEDRILYNQLSVNYLGIEISFPELPLSELLNDLLNLGANAFQRLTFLESFFQQIKVNTEPFHPVSMDAKLWSSVFCFYSQTRNSEQKSLLYLFAYLLFCTSENLSIKRFLVDEFVTFATTTPVKFMRDEICRKLKTLDSQSSAFFEASYFYLSREDDKTQLKTLWNHYRDPQKCSMKDKWLLLQKLLTFSKNESWKIYTALFQSVFIQKISVSFPSRIEFIQWFPNYLEAIDFVELSKFVLLFFRYAKNEEKLLTEVIFKFFENNLANHQVEIYGLFKKITKMKLEEFFNHDYGELWFRLGSYLCEKDLNLAIEFSNYGKSIFFDKNPNLKSLQSFYVRLFEAILTENKEGDFASSLEEITQYLVGTKQKNLKNTLLILLSNELSQGLIIFYIHLKEKSFNALEIEEIFNKVLEVFKDKELNLFQARMICKCLIEFFLKSQKLHFKNKNNLKICLKKAFSIIPQNDCLTFLDVLFFAVTDKNFDKALTEELCFYLLAQEAVKENDENIAGRIWQKGVHNEIWNQLISKEEFNNHLVTIYLNSQDFEFKKELLKHIKLEKSSNHPQAINLISAKILALLPESIKTAKNLLTKYQTILKIDEKLALLEKIALHSIENQNVLFFEVFKEWIVLLFEKFQKKEKVFNFIRYFINAKFFHLNSEKSLEIAIEFFLSKNLKELFTAHETMHFAILCLNIWNSKDFLSSLFKKSFEKIVSKISQPDIFTPTSFLILHTLLNKEFRGDKELQQTVSLDLILKNASFFFKNYHQNGFKEELIDFLSVFAHLQKSFELSKNDFEMIQKSFAYCLDRSKDKLTLLQKIHYFFSALRSNAHNVKMVELQALFAFNVFQNLQKLNITYDIEFEAFVLTRIDDVLSYENIIKEEKRNRSHINLVIDLCLEYLSQETLLQVNSLLNRFQNLFVKYSSQDKLHLSLKFIQKNLCQELTYCYRENIFENLLSLINNFKYLEGESWIELLSFFDEKDLYISQPFSCYYLDHLSSSSSIITEEQNFKILSLTLKIYTKSQNQELLFLCNNLELCSRIPKVKISDFLNLLFEGIKRFTDFPIRTLQTVFNKIIELNWLTNEIEEKLLYLFTTFFKEKDQKFLNVFLNQLLIPHFIKNHLINQQLLKDVIKQVNENYDPQQFQNFLLNLKEDVKLAHLRSSDFENVIQQLNFPIPSSAPFSGGSLEMKLIKLYGNNFDQRGILERGGEMFNHIIFLINQNKTRILNQGHFSKQIIEIHQDLSNINFFPTKQQFFQLIYAILDSENDIHVGIGSMWLAKIVHENYLLKISSQERQQLFRFIKLVIKNKNLRADAVDVFDFSSHLLYFCKSLFTLDEFETLSVLDHLIYLSEIVCAHQSDPKKIEEFYSKKPNSINTILCAKYFTLLNEIKPPSFCDYLEMSLHVFSLLFGNKDCLMIREFPGSFLKVALDNKEIFLKDFEVFINERKILENYWKNGTSLTIAGASSKKSHVDRERILREFSKISFSFNWIDSFSFGEHLTKWLFNWVEELDLFVEQENRTILFSGIYFLNLLSQFYSTQPLLKEEDLKNYFLLLQKFIMCKLNKKYPCLHRVMIIHIQPMLKRLESNSKFLKMKTRPWFAAFYGYFRLEQPNLPGYEMLKLNRVDILMNVKELAYDYFESWLDDSYALDSSCYSFFFIPQNSYYLLVSSEKRFRLFEKGLIHLVKNPFLAVLALNEKQYISLATYFSEIVSLIKKPEQEMYQEIFLNSLLEAYKCYPQFNLFIFCLHRFEEYFLGKMDKADSQLFLKKMVNVFFDKFSAMTLESKNKTIEQILAMIENFPKCVKEQDIIQIILNQIKHLRIQLSDIKAPFKIEFSNPPKP